MVRYITGYENYTITEFQYKSIFIRYGRTFLVQNYTPSVINKGW